MQTLLNQVSEIFAAEQFTRQPLQLYEPIDYTLRLGGKRIRPFLLLAANKMFGGDFEKARDAAIGIEVFHNFTLLHDDLMDRSPLRRGQPTVYRRWGDNTAILSGDTMFALAWQYFLRQPHPQLREILQCFNQTAIEVCEGQQYDMNFETATDITINQYMTMIRLKTAVLLAGALKIGALYANAPVQDIDHLYSFGIHLGLAFQLQDDLLDSYGDTATFGKQTGQDIRDNKKTYPLLCALQQSPTALRNELKDLFDSKPANSDAKVERVLEIYSQLDVKSIVENAIQQQFTLAQQHLDTLHVSETDKLPLRQLTDSLFHRKK